MDRMSFIPGPEAREQIEATRGRIIVDRKDILEYADRYLQSIPVLYQVALAVLSEGDEVELSFELGEEGEGNTRAMFKEAGGLRHRLLWETGSQGEALPDDQVIRAFHIYQSMLALYQGREPPIEVPVIQRTPSISKALSPSNVLLTSGVLWYFIELTTAPTVVSRPMRAYDALILTSIVTLANGTAPLVFAVLQKVTRLGIMPATFKRLTCADREFDPDDEADIFIVG